MSSVTLYRLSVFRKGFGNLSVEAKMSRSDLLIKWIYRRLMLGTLQRHSYQYFLNVLALNQVLIALGVKPKGGELGEIYRRCYFSFSLIN